MKEETMFYSVGLGKLGDEMKVTLTVHRSDGTSAGVMLNKDGCKTPDPYAADCHGRYRRGGTRMMTPTKNSVTQWIADSGIRVAAISGDIDHRNVYYHELERLILTVYQNAAKDMNEQAASTCENAGMEGYGTLYAAAAIRALVE